MFTYNKIFGFITGFFAVIFLLLIIGLINSSILEVLSYFSISLGITTVFMFLGKHKKTILLSGTIIYSLGTILLIINKFSFSNLSLIVIPAIILTISLAFLTLFIDDFKTKENLLTSSVLFIIGVIIILISGSINLANLLNIIKSVSLSFWIVIFLVVGILFFINNYTTKN